MFAEVASRERRELGRRSLLSEDDLLREVELSSRQRVKYAMQLSVELLETNRVESKR
jgi:hypothetical protein